jgi:DNA polymerase elongation subunit (family B)
MLIFDLETNGLLNNVTCIHCLCIFDDQAEETYVFNDQGNKQPIVRGVQMLEEADCIVGHNICGYDIPVIRKLYPWFDWPGCCVDTLILSRTLHPDLIDIDTKRRIRDMPKKLYGRHSLEAYGYRLGLNKGDFCHDADWSEWTQEMEDYCIQDVKVTTKLCDHFHPYLTGYS